MIQNDKKNAEKENGKGSEDTSSGAKGSEDASSGDSDEANDGGVPNHYYVQVPAADLQKRVVTKTNAKAVAHEAASGIESEAPASQISDGPHVPGDDSMTQGEQPAPSGQP